MTEPPKSAKESDLSVSVRDVAGVDVYQSNPLRDDGASGRRLVDNFGDLLGPMIVERMLWRRRPQGRPMSPRQQLFAVGSVLHQARTDGVVWGAGINGKQIHRYPTTYPKVDVRAVRGPWTARLLTDLGVDVPAVFGDPALLLPRLLPELSSWAHTPVADTLVVPNYHELDAYRDSEHPVLDPRLPLHTVLRTIARSRFVVGSSLYAVIIADSLGIPARFVASGSESPFKYRDYLAGTGRPTTRIARDVAEAHHLGGHEPLDADLDALEDAFPWDLWGFPATDRGHIRRFELDAVQDAWRNRVVPEGAATARSAFLQEDLPRLRTAVTGGTPDGPALVSAAADLLTHVVPDVLDEPLDPATRHLIDTTLRRDAGLVATAARLEGTPPVAMLHAIHPGARHTVLSLAVRVPETIGDSDVEVALTATKSGRTIIQPVLLFGQARKQWHVVTDVLLPIAELAGESWSVEARIGDVRLPVHHASADQLSLSAPVSGDESARGKPIVVTPEGTIQHEEKDAA